MQSLFDMLTSNHSSGHTSPQEEEKKNNDNNNDTDSNGPPIMAHSIHWFGNKTSECGDEEKRKSRNVTFFPSVIVYNYLGRDELSEDEKRNAWYNREELHKVHLDNIETVHRMTCGAWTTTATEESVFCARGLEGRTNAGTRRRWKNRLDAIQIVRRHQVMEMESGGTNYHHDPISLAEAYAQRTKESAQIARLMANIDAQSVQQQQQQQQQEAAATMPILLSPSKLPTRGSPDHHHHHLFRRLPSVECPSPTVLRAQ